MKQRYNLIFAIIFIFFNPAFSQGDTSVIENYRKEVCQINNLSFDRIAIPSKAITINDYYDVKFPNYRDVSENMSYIYKDNDGKIRKFVTMWNHPEMSGYEVHYFDTKGELLCSYIHIRSYMMPHFYGYRYMSDGKQQYCDIDVYDEDRDMWERITYSGGNILLTSYNSFDCVLHADSVVSVCNFLYEMQDVFSKNSTNKVRFVTPEKGDKSVINVRGVSIREKDNINGSTMYQPLFGEIIEVFEKGKEDYIEPYGKHNWFKVIVNGKTGYIFGAFLEPVEKEVKK